MVVLNYKHPILVVCLLYPGFSEVKVLGRGAPDATQVPVGSDASLDSFRGLMDATEDKEARAQ